MLQPQSDLNESDFTFIGFEEMEAIIRYHLPEAGYLFLQDRTQRGAAADAVGRFDLTIEEARRWSDAPETVTSADDIVHAAMRWLQRSAQRYAVGADMTRFRMRVYAPKAYRMLGGGHFVVLAKRAAA